MLQTAKISRGETVSVVVGQGGTPAAFNTEPVATQGQDTSIAFAESSVTASGGGFGGSRGWNKVYSLGGVGGSGGGGGGGGCQGGPDCGTDTSGGAGSGLQGSSGGEGYRKTSDAMQSSAGAGGGGFGQAGTAGANCLAGNGGDGYALPFAPIMSSLVAGGGAGALTVYTNCPNPMFGINGMGQSSYGGGGQAGCGNGGQPDFCSAQAGMAGVAFINFSFACPAGSGAAPGFFSASPCSPCLPGSFSFGTPFCLPCPAGRFSTLANSSSCDECPLHTYNPDQGSSNSSACLPCPSGTCTSKSGSSNVSACHMCPLPSPTPPNATIDALQISPAAALWILGSAAASSGHVPRVLELVQFMSIYCTSLAPQQQSSISAFQIGSMTGALAATKQEFCAVCPGQCLQPLVMVVPTFALLSSLAFVTFVSYVLIRRNSAAAPGSAEDRLLAEDPALSAESRFISRPQKIAHVVVQYYRNFIETCSSYVIMPVMFVFVLNAWPSSFSTAEMWDRVMIISLPITALMFRSFVIFKRFVHVTFDDQKLMCVNSTCYCCIATTLSVYFMLNRDEKSANSNSTFSSDLLPQYIVLALLTVQLIAHVFIRRRATGPFVFYNTRLPWQMHSTRESAYSTSANRSREATRYPFTASAVEFAVANYLVLSQIAMVATGLISSFAPFSSGPRNHDASVVIGIIPLCISGVLLLRAVLHFTIFLWRACISKKSKHPEHKLHSFRSSSRNSRY